MVNFAIIFIVIIAVLIILVVLAQNPKGSGMSAAFGGSGATQLMGAKRTTDILEKITWGMGIGIFVLSLIVNVSLSSSDDQGGTYTSPVSQDIQQSAVPNAGGQTLPSPNPQNTEQALPNPQDVNTTNTTGETDKQ